jgi:hypothetical protein
MQNRLLFACSRLAGKQSHIHLGGIHLPLIVQGKKIDIVD